MVRACWRATDACVAPVLDLDEAPEHPHNRARETFVTIDDIVQPAPAPRLSRTPAAISRPPPDPGADTERVLREWGFAAAEVEALRAAGAIE
jgi:alpha-methylacyl-CoA racemase